jgi:hypothetical protein
MDVDSMAQGTERLSQHFRCLWPERRQLVQEQPARVRQTQPPPPWRRPISQASMAAFARRCVGPLPGAVTEWDR